MSSYQARKTVVFVLWALVVCPAIGFVVAWLADPGGDLAFVLLFVALPSALALIAGIALRQTARLTVLGATLAASIGFAILLALVVLTQAG